jgi:6-pyruvoyltetrahydropterin/6-carboxytetrahydropterin synthase
MTVAMKVYLTRRYLFVASHRLHNPMLSESANQECYGKCNHSHGHGHNYFLEVTVSGPIAPQTGTVCDLDALDSVVKREILDRFDHQNLNQLQEFAEIIPTTENLAIQVQQILSRVPLPAHLESIRIEETPKNSFEYAAASAPRR